MNLKDIETVNKLTVEKQAKLSEIGSCGTALLRFMIREFNLTVFEQDDIMKELHLVEQAYVALGQAEYMHSYLNQLGFTWTEELPDPVIDAFPTSSQAMLAFLTTLRNDFGFNTADINDITPKLKEYTTILREYGSVSMELQIVTPKEG